MINEQRTFGSTFGSATPAASNDRPDARVWANIGYEVDSADGKYSFVSLSQGVAIDTMEAKPVTSRDALHADFQNACGTLVSDVQAVAAKLAPGESKIYGERGSLQIQLRRVADPVAAAIPTGVSQFATKLAL